MKKTTLEETYPSGRSLYYEGDDLRSFDDFLRSIGINDPIYSGEYRINAKGEAIPLANDSEDRDYPLFFCPSDKLQALYDSGHPFGS